MAGKKDKKSAAKSSGKATRPATDAELKPGEPNGAEDAAAAKTAAPAVAKLESVAPDEVTDGELAAASTGDGTPAQDAVKVAKAAVAKAEKAREKAKTASAVAAVAKAKGSPKAKAKIAKAKKAAAKAEKHEARAEEAVQAAKRTTATASSSTPAVGSSDDAGPGSSAVSAADSSAAAPDAAARGHFDDAGVAALGRALPRVLELTGALDPQVRRAAFDSYVSLVLSARLHPDDLPVLQLRAGEGSAGDGESRAADERVDAVTDATSAASKRATQDKAKTKAKAEPKAKAKGKAKAAPKADASPEATVKPKAKTKTEPKADEKPAAKGKSTATASATRPASRRARSTGPQRVTPANEGASRSASGASQATKKDAGTRPAASRTPFRATGPAAKRPSVAPVKRSAAGADNAASASAGASTSGATTGSGRPATTGRATTGTSAPRALLSLVARVEPRRNDERVTVVVAHLGAKGQTVPEDRILDLFGKLSWRAPVNLATPIRQAVRLGYLELRDGGVGITEAGRTFAHGSA